MKKGVSSSHNWPSTIIIATELQKTDSQYIIQISQPPYLQSINGSPHKKKKINGVGGIPVFPDRLSGLPEKFQDFRFFYSSITDIKRPIFL